MKRGIDTHLLAARQVVVWPVPGGQLEQLATDALRLPRYVVHRIASLAGILDALSRSKIEVGLVEVDGSDGLPDLEQVRGVDPDLAIVIVTERSRITTIAPAVGGKFDLVALPLAPIELVTCVEKARELRYLRRSEQRGKRAEARMTAIVHAVPTGIVTIDEDGVIHDWNPAAARIFGWSDVEALGRSIWELLAIDPAVFRNEKAHLVFGKKIELSARHRSGRDFPIDMSLVSVPLSERTMTCAIVEDRSEAKRLELELRQAQKLEAVGQLAAGLAHEINTPCQFIGDHTAYLKTAWAGVTSLLTAYAGLRNAGDCGSNVAEALADVRRAEDDADLAYAVTHVPQSLQGIAEGVHRIADIVRAMKSFARKDWSDAAGVDINEVLNNVLTIVEHERAAVADVETTLEPLPPMIGDGGELGQALFNIVRNAIEAIAARGAQGAIRGRIAVRTRPENGGILVEIADTGCGIPAAIRGRIFEPFFTTKEVGRGPGQGLAVAWSVVVEKHGGSLSFETEEGAGTTFAIRLPLAP
jgi:PAS domain S-box-containing protein